MKQFYPLKVIDISRETAHAKAITFEISNLLQQHFEFQAGQYVTIRHKDAAGKVYIRCYSISSKPSAQHITIGVKKVIGGAVSPFLVDDLSVGDSLEVAAPEGNFKISPSILRSNTYVFIAGGSGITPIKAMIADLLENEPRAIIYLIYGNRDEESIIFKSFFEDISASKENFHLIHCLSEPASDWQGEKGLLTTKKTIEIVSSLNLFPKKAHYYICGPTPMMDGNLEALKALDVPENQVNTEYFVAATS